MTIRNSENSHLEDKAYKDIKREVYAMGSSSYFFISESSNIKKFSLNAPFYRQNDVFKPVFW
jgi:hypothetical protein